MISLGVEPAAMGGKPGFATEEKYFLPLFQQATAPPTCPIKTHN